MKYTIIITEDENGNQFNFEVPGHLNEQQCLDSILVNAPDNFFRDYINANVGEAVSCQIHKRFH